MSDAAARDTTNTEAAHTAGGLRVSSDAAADGVSPADADSDAADSAPRAAPLAPDARRKLATLLLAKTTLELLLVAALAVGFHYAAFHPYFRGSLDFADGRTVEGWVVDRAEPSRAVEVQLYLNGEFAASGLADWPRPDVAAKGFAPDARHGFVFRLDPPRTGEHEARVYAVHASGGGARRTLQLVGSPLRFAAK